MVLSFAKEMRAFLRNEKAARAIAGRTHRFLSHHGMLRTHRTAHELLMRGVGVQTRKELRRHLGSDKFHGSLPDGGAAKIIEHALGYSDSRMNPDTLMSAFLHILRIEDPKAFIDTNDYGHRLNWLAFVITLAARNRDEFSRGLTNDLQAAVKQSRLLDERFYSKFKKSDGHRTSNGAAGVSDVVVGAYRKNRECDSLTDELYTSLVHSEVDARHSVFTDAERSEIRASIAGTFDHLRPDLTFKVELDWLEERIAQICSALAGFASEIDQIVSQDFADRT